MQYLNIFTLIIFVVGILSIITVIGWFLAGRLDKKYGTEREPVRIEIVYSHRATMPQRLERHAQELDITPEQLVKRFISEGMGKLEPDEACIPGYNLNDFLIKNGLHQPDKKGT